MRALLRSPAEWLRTNPDAVASGSDAQIINVLTMALHDISAQTDRFTEQLDYGIELQRIIYAICHGTELPESGKDGAPYHYQMAKEFMEQAK